MFFVPPSGPALPTSSRMETRVSAFRVSERTGRTIAVTVIERK
jgi:hypothetical protein